MGFVWKQSISSGKTLRDHSTPTTCTWASLIIFCIQCHAIFVTENEPNKMIPLLVIAMCSFPPNLNYSFLPCCNKQEALSHRSTFPRNSSDSSWDFAFTPKRSGTRTFFANLFTPFQSLVERWYFPGEEKVPISDWLGELQTTPRKTPKGFVKPPFYLLALALLALALAQRTNGERLTYGNTK